MSEFDPFGSVQLRERVQARLDTTMREQEQVLAEVGPDVHDLLLPVQRLLAGGKRLRAAFLYWGYRYAGRDDCDQIITVASAMELFQAAALIHDDVMDDSDTRRGHPATHRQLAGAHRERDWDGQAERFGIAGAILAGNLCLTWADMLYAQSGMPAADLERGRPLFDVMRTLLMAGQYTDVVSAARPWTGVDHQLRVDSARHVIRYKSAKYTIEHPLLIGTQVGGLDPAGMEALSHYGLALGEAFQLRDDLLGVFGDPAHTGKPAGDDLREGKRTVLMARALARMAPAQARHLEQSIGDAALSGEQVEQLRQMLITSGAPQQVETDITALTQQAHQALSRAQPRGESDAHRALVLLIELAASRVT